MESNELAVMNKPQVQPQTVHLVARNPNEMATSRESLLLWLTNKIASCQAEIDEVKEIAAHAKKNKWRTSGLDRQVKLAEKRMVFYVKVKAASEAGYAIVPNFASDVFAVRVTRNNPSSKPNSSTYSDPIIQDEKPSVLAIGEGTYVSPEAVLQHWETTEKDGKGNEITRYHSEPVEFQDVEFPIACARPEVMSAVSEAMAQKLFDSFSIAPRGIMRKRKYDPIVLGQIMMAKSGSYTDPKTVSFLIAWHLDLRTL